MASIKDTCTFYTEGTASQFQYVLSLYPEVLKLKAVSKNKKPEDLAKLDYWYQNELPKKIKSRGKDAHCIHEELVQLMKWKQTRGKYYPQLNYLVKVNTPRAVLNETKKAFKKLPNLEQAITALSNLKGVGITLASALLAAAAPDIAPFMAEECLKGIPGNEEGLNFTTKEYLNFVSQMQSAADRLSKESDNGSWTLHKIELALWTHFVANQLKPELLDSIPCANGSASAVNDVSHQNGEVTTTASNSPSENAEASNDAPTADNPDNTDETTGDANEDTSSINEDSLDKTPVTRITGDITNDDEVTNDSVITSDSATNDSVDVENKRNNDVLNFNEETCSSFLEPPNKKVKLQPENGSEENNVQDSESSSIDNK